MTVARRTFVWPLLVALVGALWLLVVVDLLPEAAGDILLRAWPALLILFGFDLLAGRRQLRVGQQGIGLNWVALVATVVFLAVIVWLAYAQQADVVRDDNRASFAEPVGETTGQLRLSATVERTAITIQPGASGARDVTAQYAGSEESDITFEWNGEGDVAALSIVQTESGSIPKLESYGRGTLDVTVPADVPIQELTVGGSAGDITADLQPLRIGQLNLAVGEGDLQVDLPGDATLPLTGVLRTGGGDIVLTVPRGAALTLSLGEGSGQPTYEYDTLQYDLLINGTLKLKNTDSFQIALTVSLPDGAHLTVSDAE